MISYNFEIDEFEFTFMVYKFFCAKLEKIVRKKLIGKMVNGNTIIIIYK